MDFLRSLPDLSSSLADPGSFSWEMRELAILRRGKEGGEVDVTSLGSTPWTDWTKAKWQCGTSEGHYFLSKRLLMLQFMTRAATAKLRADRHLCVHTTDSTRATCTLVDISTAEFRDKCFQRSVWNSLVCVKGNDGSFLRWLFLQRRSSVKSKGGSRWGK